MSQASAANRHRCRTAKSRTRPPASSRQASSGNIPDVLGNRVFTVISAREATPATRIVRLSLGGTSFRYTAGQAALLGLPDRAERVPYSIASSPEETIEHGYLEFLLKVDPDEWGTRLAALRRGSEMTVDGPVGTFVFPPHPEERQFLFVAGGTGIAPLRSMITHAFHSKQPGRLHLLYSARTPADFAYLPELRGYAREGRLELALTATREVPPGWPGERGRITRDRLAPLVEDPETLCFVCGPAAMVDEVPRMLMEIGVERTRIRLEEW